MRTETERQQEARDRRGRQAVKGKKFMDVERRAVGLMPKEEE